MGTEYTHLQPSEREHLCQRRIEGASLRTIGRELGRDPGTLSQGRLPGTDDEAAVIGPKLRSARLGLGASGATAASGMPS